MDNSVTFYTKCLSIRSIKSLLWKICPCFNVVGVNLTFCAANTATILVSFVNSVSPLSKLIRFSGAFSFKGFSVFPCRGIFSALIFFRTSAGTQFLSFIERIKRAFALRTYFDVWCSAVRPTFLAAKMGAVGSVGMSPIFLSTNSTDKINPFPSVFATDFIVTIHRTATSPLCAFQKVFSADFTNRKRSFRFKVMSFNKLKWWLIRSRAFIKGCSTPTFTGIHIMNISEKQTLVNIFLSYCDVMLNRWQIYNRNNI